MEVSEMKKMLSFMDDNLKILQFKGAFNHWWSFLKDNSDGIGILDICISAPVFN